MPIFTAAAAYIAAEVGITSVFGLAAVNFGVRILATAVISNLISNRMNDQGSPTATDNGNRVQLPPATDNKLPIVYGTATISPIITDAKMSTDQKTMWYVMALSEVYQDPSFGRMWWGDKELIFGDPLDRTKVTKWINGNDQQNTNVNGNMNVYLYGNGSNSPTNNNLVTAIDILSDERIALEERWTSNYTMSNTMFAIVKINYNKDANLTGLEQFKIEVSQSSDAWGCNPADVINDYLVDPIYGCGIDTILNNQIDSTSIDELRIYCNEEISYIDTDGFTQVMPRYRFNGPINTNNNCLTNLQLMVDTCDSWLQWNEIKGQWAVKINRSYTDYTTTGGLFIVNEDNIIGGVNITPVDLNSTYNSIEAQFPNFKIRDQTDYSYVEIDPADKNPNEPANKLVIQLPMVNNSITAKYLTTRRLIQSREDLVVEMNIDYSGIQIEAGDVIRVGHSIYGWGPYADNLSNPYKLFRVQQVTETTDSVGNLGVKILLAEYNEQVYQNIDIHDYTPALNTGIPNPGWISVPGTPTITQNLTPTDNAQLTSFDVSATVPTTGTVLYMDFYYGLTEDTSTYKLYKTVAPSSGRAFINGETIIIHVNDLPSATYYWSVKARNATTAAGDAASANSSPSAPSAWKQAALMLPILAGSQWLGGIAKEWLQDKAVDTDKIADKAVATAKIKDNAVTPAQVSSKLYGPTKTIYFNPASTNGIINSVTDIVDTYRNRSISFPGEAVDPSVVYPWYQGTDGGTGEFQPDNNRSWTIYEGDYNWYKAVYWDISDDPLIPDGDWTAINMRLAFMSDVPNCEFQICYFVVFEQQQDAVSLSTGDSFSTHTTSSAAPYLYEVTLSDFTGTTGGAGVQVGYAIRNMTAGSTLSLINGAGTYDARAWPAPYYP